MTGHKFDHPPLLAPGRHFMTLSDVEALCVHRFSGLARSKRARLFYGLEELVQNLLQVGLRCSLFVDGSFLTEKDLPDDLDVLVNIDLDVMTNLSIEQRILVDAINQLQYIDNVDSWAATSYPRDHRYFGTALDIGNAGDAYGLEHSKFWLKGIAVLTLGETDVGLRICR
jgi:hypothetical protein